jgi:Mrp family chromosome partitioning ATPase
VVYPPDLVVRVDASHAEPMATGDSGAWAWPEISHKLLQSTAGGGLISLADSLESLCVQRRIRSLAITGQGRGTGRTTLLLTLARLLVERTSLRVLLVDFDFGNPCLAAGLGFSPAIDIAHLVYEGAGAGETLAQLIPYRFGLLPLAHPMEGSELTGERQAALRELLRSTAANYDLTLIDGGPCDLMIESMSLEAPFFDACLAVSRHAGASADSNLPEAFLQRGIEYLGTVETFVPAVPRSEPHFIR